MSNRKSKMISIRLSAEEYQRLRELCEQHGSRNISELARDAMNQLLGPNAMREPRRSDDHGIDAQLKTLQLRLESLNADMAMLARVVEMRRAAGV